MRGSRKPPGSLLMQIKEKMAEEMGYEVLHGIVDCLWVIGEGLGRSGVCLYEVADK